MDKFQLGEGGLEVFNLGSACGSRVRQSDGLVRWRAGECAPVFANFCCFHFFKSAAMSAEGLSAYT